MEHFFCLFFVWGVYGSIACCYVDLPKVLCEGCCNIVYCTNTQIVVVDCQLPQKNFKILSPFLQPQMFFLKININIKTLKKLI